jgi:hypothetical protein
MVANGGKWWQINYADSAVATLPLKTFSQGNSIYMALTDDLKSSDRRGLKWSITYNFTSFHCCLPLAISKLGLQGLVNAEKLYLSETVVSMSI